MDILVSVTLVANSRTGIEIPDCSYKSFSTFLLYLYTDRIEPLPRAADEAIGKTFGIVPTTEAIITV